MIRSLFFERYNLIWRRVYILGAIAKIVQLKLH
jgi:hypothetical protein